MKKYVFGKSFKSIHKRQSSQHLCLSVATKLIVLFNRKYLPDIERLQVVW